MKPLARLIYRTLYAPYLKLFLLGIVFGKRRVPRVSYRVCFLLGRGPIPNKSIRYRYRK